MILRLSFAHPSVVVLVRTGETGGTSGTSGTGETGETSETSGIGETSGIKVIKRVLHH